MSENTELDAELANIHPVEKSRSGQNAYYHFCHVRGAQQNYAVCTHILAAIEEGRIGKDSFVDCQRAFTRDDCEAKKMRAEEITAGHSLYFKERTNLNPLNSRPEREAQERALVVSSGKYDMSNPSFARGWNMAGGGSEKSGKALTSKNTSGGTAVSRKPTPPKPKTGFIEADMADLVNVIASDKPKQPAPPKADALSPASSIKPNPGETPLEFARRRAQLMKGAN